MPTAPSLPGTWRLLSYETWTAEGVATEPLGPAPAGFAVFDAAGHAFIQLARAADDGLDAGALAQSFIAYFGTFTVDEAGSEFTVLVEASNMPAYVGSRQVRAFRIDGDTLVLGVEGQYRARLRRAA